MNNKVVIINGCGGAGKDTFVSYCQELNKNVLNVSTISRAKAIAELCGWNGEKKEKDRRFLSDLKDALTKWDNSPLEHVITFVESKSNKIIFIHCREPKEIKKIYETLLISPQVSKVCTLLITNCNVPKINSNHADKEVECYDYDFTIQNNDTKEELKSKAEYFLKTIERN